MLNLIITYLAYTLIYFIGTLTTIFLHNHIRFSMVISVVVVGFIGSILGSFFHAYTNKHTESLIFSGALAAMAGNSFSLSFSFFSFTSLIATIIYFNSLHFFSEMGGRLGTIAFLSTGSSLLIYSMIYG